MEITCPSCNRKIQSKADVRGRKVKCPSCGTAFKVPGSPGQESASPTGAKSSAAKSSGKIKLTCECGKQLQVPASAAGKKAKCQCGRVVSIPSASSKRATGAKAAKPQPVEDAFASAFQSVSEDEWQSIANQASPPEPDPFEEEEPKKKTAAEEIMERAAIEMGETKDQKKDAATKSLWAARWLLLFVGGLNATIWILALVLFESVVGPIIDQVAADAAEQGEDVDLGLLKTIFRVFIGVNLGIAILYIVLGILIFAFPMTCTITALSIFVILEVIGFIIAPSELLSIGGWIRRFFIGGGLIAAVNNASYYKYINQKKSKKPKSG